MSRALRVILSREDGEGSPAARRIVIALALACAASRLVAMARSIWDSDEALFCLAMRDYDVTAHHPHPPGFPLFIALAKVMRVFVSDDFRALQSVSLVAGMLAFPAVFFFARAIGLRFEVAAIAGTLFAVFPNVWFFGGTAFSDVPAIVLALVAVALLWRAAGEASPIEYWFGTVALALAIGIRPQNLLIGLIPGIAATVRRKPAEIVVAVVIGLLVTGAAYGGAIQATGSLEDYVRAVREHAEYLGRVDSFRSPGRPALLRLLHPFFVMPYRAPAPSIAVTLLVLLSIVRSVRGRSLAMLRNVATFGPFAVMALLLLDRFSVSRFSIAYLPLFAIFAADGIAWTRWPRTIASIVVAAFVVWTMPALNVARTTISPPVQAALAAKRQPGKLFCGITMTTFLDLYAPERSYVRVMDDRALPLSDSNGALLLAEITRTEPRGLVFRRERGHLWNIVRHQFFEVKLEPVTRHSQFASGWEPPVVEGSEEWRWMNGTSTTVVPPREGLLRMHFVAPQRQEVVISLNGVVLERFAAEGYVERDYRVKATQPENVLTIAATRLRFRFLGL